MALSKLLMKLAKEAMKKKKKVHSDKNPRKKQSTYLSGKGKSKTKVSDVDKALRKTSGLKVERKGGTLVGEAASARFKVLMASKLKKKPTEKKAKKKKLPELEMPMSTAKKKQMRDTALDKLSQKPNASGVTAKMKRAFQDISPRDRTVLIATIATGNAAQIKKAFSGRRITPREFIKVRKMFKGE